MKTNIPALKASADRLNQLSRAINKREPVLLELKTAVLNKWLEYLAEVLLQGRDLLEAKGLLGHGPWESWLATHCPKSAWMARAYMRLASNSGRIADFENAGSLRKCMDLLVPSNSQSSILNTPRQWPPFLEGIQRFSKWLGFVEKHPIDQWPNDGRDELRTKLEPVAKSLWPDRFA